jgi:hypothetical protein
MEWKIKSVSSPQILSGDRLSTPGVGDGTVPFRHSTAPREIHWTTVDGRDWETIERQIVEYWVRISRVLRDRYASLVPQWDRIVFETDPVNNGKIMTLLRVGDDDPAEDDPATIMVYIPFAAESGRNMSLDAATPWDAVEERMVLALARAATYEPAASSIAALWDWHRFSLFTMSWHEASMRPLAIPGFPNFLLPRKQP